MTLDNIRIALHGIWANRLRSSLTTLGILIGVAAVIVLVAVGNGAARFVQQQLESLGTNTLFVIATSDLGPGGGGGNRPGTASRQIGLTTEDVRALGNKTRAPDIVAIAPELDAIQITGTYRGSTHTPQQFIGTTAEYFEILNSKLSVGSFFTDEDVAQHRKVVVLGSTVVTELFGRGVNPVGESVKFGGINFRVSGVLRDFGGFEDQNNFVVAPLTTVQDTLTGNTGAFSALTIQAASRERTDAAEAQILAVLASTHKLPAGEVEDFFEVFSQASLLETTNQFTTVFTLALGAVAAISLLVGGIGVMNIMLVTVTERIREIGIRKAIGARRGDILAQFLVEAVLLTGLGGTLGIAVGLAVGQLRLGEFALVVRPSSVVLAFAVAVAVGLFFGIYPAKRAASLNPVEALRYE